MRFRFPVGLVGHPQAGFAVLFNPKLDGQACSCWSVWMYGQ
jgi:hypothetical protein